VSGSAESLIQQLADPVAGKAAGQALLRQGPAAVEALLAALGRDPGLELRTQILRILSELKDERAHETFRRALDSNQEDLRAIGARGLHRLGAPEALDACIATIDDSPDPLHCDVTPSAQALSEMGLSALPAILPLLGSANDRTRQRAQKVLETVTFKEVSAAVKPRPLSDRARAEWADLWKRNGSYRWDGPTEARKAAIERWQQWLGARARHRS
jgi:hypothetical protein